VSCCGGREREKFPPVIGLGLEETRLAQADDAADARRAAHEEQSSAAAFCGPIKVDKLRSPCMAMRGHNGPVDPGL
jgi:hypothetical protein